MFRKDSTLGLDTNEKNNSNDAFFNNDTFIRIICFLFNFGPKDIIIDNNEEDTNNNSNNVLTDKEIIINHENLIVLEKNYMDLNIGKTIIFDFLTKIICFICDHNMAEKYRNFADLITNLIMKCFQKFSSISLSQNNNDGTFICWPRETAQNTKEEILSMKNIVNIINLVISVVPYTLGIELLSKNYIEY
jgi:hypothetical protein